MPTASQRLTFIVLALMLQTGPAWAVQEHGGAEGLVAHQLGHSLFVIGMGYLLFRLHSLRQAGRGWREFKIFLWSLIAWNVVTFSGHWMQEFVPKGQFVTSHAGTVSFTVASLFDAFYYLTRLDHLILVPSFVFLLLALRKWRQPQ